MPFLVPLLALLACETPTPPGGGSCDLVQELQWSEPSPLGFSGSDLAAAASGTWNLDGVDFQVPNAAPPEISLVYPSTFQAGAPLTVGIEAEQGAVQYVSGVGCTPHLRVHSLLVLRSQENLLTERLALKLESANRQKVHFKAELGNFSALRGQLKEVKPNLPGVKILGLKVQGELQVGLGPIQLGMNAEVQAATTAASGAAPAPSRVNIFRYDRRQGTS